MQSLPRIFVEGALGEGSEIVLPPAQAHYLTNVLRLPAGARLLVFNGKDGEWLAEIASAKKSSVAIRAVERERRQTAPQDLLYVFAPLKQARLDYLVQKAVEMGVSELQPVLTARTVASRVNLDRMRANAIEAAEQCGILSIPEIKPPAKLPSVLKSWPRDRCLIFCDESAAAASPLENLKKVDAARKLGVLVGPEGGFTKEERELLLGKPWVCPISLGPRIMRADTAAVAALALVNAVLGDWR